MIPKGDGGADHEDDDEQVFERFEHEAEETLGLRSGVGVGAEHRLAGAEVIAAPVYASLCVGGQRANETCGSTEAVEVLEAALLDEGPKPAGVGDFGGSRRCRVAVDIDRDVGGDPADGGELLPDEGAHGAAGTNHVISNAPPPQRRRGGSRNLQRYPFDQFGRRYYKLIESENGFSVFSSIK